MTEKNHAKDLFIKILGKHIRERRKAMGLTLRKLADETLLDDKHLGRLERGEKEPGSHTLILIHKELNLDIDDCHWMFFHHIAHIQRSKNHNKTLITFSNQTQLPLPISHYIFKKQYERTFSCMMGIKGIYR